MDNNIKVLIIGTTGSGKSTIAQLIRQALLDNDIQSKVVDCDGDVFNTTQMIDGNVKRIRELLKFPLVIETVQAKRSS